MSNRAAVVTWAFVLMIVSACGQDVPISSAADAPSAADARSAPDAGSVPDAQVTPDAQPTPDAQTDANSRVPAPEAVFPPNGYTTGSIHVAAEVEKHPLRPKFLWTAVPQADEYQLQITSECAIEGFRTCPFSNPTIDETTADIQYRSELNLEVNTTAPVGRRYYWRVRACRVGTDCSEWSEVRYLDVGRDSHDFNGDGYADVVVAAPDDDAGGKEQSGRASVYYGAQEGLQVTAPLVLDREPEEGGRFGISVASAGDVNGDGYADAVVGAYHETVVDYVDAGHVYVYFGGQQGLQTTAPVRLESENFIYEGEFGGSVAGAGDVNGDGYADFIVSAIGEAGAPVYVYFGAQGGLQATHPASLYSENPQGGGFGKSVASAGDVNNDGFADVIIGAYRETVGENADAGRAYVYFGGQMGLQGTPIVLESENPLGNYFGRSVGSAGDVNGDGYAEVIIGASVETSDQSLRAGRAYVYLGGEAGLQVAAPVTLASDNPGLHGTFGDSLASAGDVNGDGYADVMVGAGLEDDGDIWDAGQVYVYLGTQKGLQITADVILHTSNPKPFGTFGASLASAGDVNGDGYADVIVGAPGEDLDNLTAAGRAYVFLGEQAGLGAIADVILEAENPQLGAAFGWSIASARPVDRKREPVRGINTDLPRARACEHAREG